MKLTDLDPRWTSRIGGAKTGVSFLCPCCRNQRIAVDFAPAIGDAPTWPPSGLFIWNRQGDTFEILTLHPSIDVSRFGHWHGSVANGEVK